MKIVWRKSAITSLLELDRWRASIELPPIASYLKDTIQQYFTDQDYSIYTRSSRSYSKNASRPTDGFNHYWKVRSLQSFLQNNYKPN